VGGWVGGKKVSLRTTSQRSWDVVKNKTNHVFIFWNTCLHKSCPSSLMRRYIHVPKPLQKSHKIEEIFI
jgi:hypothetical protein